MTYRSDGESSDAREKVILDIIERMYIDAESCVVVDVTCRRCGKAMTSLAALALHEAAIDNGVLCISCDPAAESSSAVSKVRLSGNWIKWIGLF